MVCINLFLSVIRKGTDWKPFQTRFRFNHLLFWAIYLKVLWWLKCQETWVQISGLPLHKVKLFTFSKFQLVHQWNGLVTSIYRSAVLHEEHENWPQSAWNAADIQYRIWILLCMSHPQILVLCSFVSLMKKTLRTYRRLAVLIYKQHGTYGARVPKEKDNPWGSLSQSISMCCTILSQLKAPLFL